jgi:hypothetical protein
MMLVAESGQKVIAGHRPILSESDAIVAQFARGAGGVASIKKTGLRVVAPPR